MRGFPVLIMNDRPGVSRRLRWFSVNDRQLVNLLAGTFGRWFRITSASSRHR